MDNDEKVSVFNVETKNLKKNSILKIFNFSFLYTVMTLIVWELSFKI